MPPEFFDTAEIAINEGDQSWGNLGLWQEQDSYSSACRNLAIALGSMAGLDETSHVLDVGFGCGDQLLLWLEHFQVATLQGINLSATQTQGATELLHRRGYDKHCEHLTQGDICDSSLWPARGAQAPTCILCLDSAYHFQSKPVFFEHAAHSLPVGGKLCLTDFVLPEDFRPGMRELPLHAMLWASRIPRGNIMTAARYAEQLVDSGFSSIEVRDISQEVMLGFAGWWRCYRERAGHLPTRSRLKYLITARFLDWAFTNNVLRYVMVCAQRKP
ncbi:MAG: methyltransferase domain-containing protein [Halieaceae bacterium]|nr:methyltransferase domain-containing protein [Halieaceae bacterium]